MDAFIAAGFTKRDVLDVATKVMSNHTNPIVHRISSVPLDARLVDVEIGDARRVELEADATSKVERWEAHRADVAALQALQYELGRLAGAKA